jgi:uncharacterized integral membrane protein
VRRLAWIITLPVTVLVVVFAVANRQEITINLWPLEETATYPLFMVVLGALVFGFLLGAVIMWLSEGRLRDRARRLRYEKEDIEREFAFVQRQKAKSEATPAATVAGPKSPSLSPSTGLPATANN